MNVIKRDGSIVLFDKNRIINAINKVFFEVDGALHEINTAKEIAEKIERYDLKDDISVEEIQDLVEDYLMSSKRKDVARAYIRFRQKKEILRDTNKAYDGILKLVDMKNEELKSENSNKNATIASTQRDYMAGEVSKDLTKRFLLPTAVWKAHEAGEIHFHDADYFAQHVHNCCLVNLEDMLQNGTVINKTLIERPHSFATACNIATQVMAIVASGEYGGQSISLTHLAPFVDVSRQKIHEEVKNELKEINANEKLIEEIVEKRLKREIQRGIQTIQYQINTLNTSNG